MNGKKSNTGALLSPLFVLVGFVEVSLPFTVISVEKLRVCGRTFDLFGLFLILSR